MATRFSSTLIYDITTDARFRAIAQFVEDTFISTGGWVATLDAGQTLPSALLHPTVASQKMGYRIYRMSDPLQSTAPVFVRIDFGSTLISTCPGFWLTIGTGSDGSGNITGILFNGGATTVATINGNTSSGSSPSQATLSYGSAFHERVAIALCSNPVTSSATIIFTLERSKDAVGDNTGDGLLLIYKGGTSPGPVDVTRYIKFVGVQPLPENGLSYILSCRNPSQMFYPGDIGVGIVIHIAGIAQQPGVNMLITNSGDVTIDATIQLTLYSRVRTYVHCGIIMPRKAQVFTGGQTAVDTNARILMRYD